MKTTRVFLLGDIGSDKNGLYHVGDESMFLSNLEKYLKLSNFEISASSRSISHSSLKINEYLDIYIPNLWQFIKLIFQSYLLKYFKINLFPSFFKPTVLSLIKSDILHISGGGNINSLWSGHIYYRALMIFLAHLFNKTIILTSQTIGPITHPIHKHILKIIFKKANYIGVRDKKFSYDQLLNLCVDKKYIYFNYDDALLWKNKNIKKDNKILKIGISLHDPKNSNISKQLEFFIENIYKEYKNINIYLIPHLLDKKDNFDVKFMTKLVKDINSHKIKVINYNFLTKSNRSIEIAEKIKRITNDMDLMIASRYHGLVFALSASTPSLSINYDKNYYQAKNTGILKQFFKDVEKFVVDFDDIKSDYMLSKTKTLIKKRERISKHISKKLIKIYAQDKKNQNHIYRLERNSLKI